MNDEQVSIIVQAIAEARVESTKAIGELATTVAQFRGNIEARVCAAEEFIVADKKWSRVKNALGPAYVILHGIAAHFGLKI